MSGVYVALILVFFVTTIALVYACEKLRKQS